MTTTAAATPASPSNDYPTRQPPSSPGVVPMDQDQETTTNNEEPQPPPDASKQQQQSQVQQPPQQQQSESQESELPISQQQPPTTSPPLSQQQHANAEQRRPMNAFLVFCKSRRSDLRNKFKDLDNRNVTRMLGLEWSKLDKDSKKVYHDKARQHKEAFMKANPDFKWCKTPMSSSNNNCNANNSLNSNSNDCYATNNRHSEPLPTAHIVDHQHLNNHHSNQAVTHQSNSSGSSSNSSTSSTTSTTAGTTTICNNMDTFTSNNRQMQQQHEAPKPPKKRFLEKNNSSMMYSTKNNSSNIINSNSNNFSTNNEPILQHVRDQFPPMKFHDQDIYDKVIEDAFKETKADASPKAMCKYPSRCSTNNLTTSSATQLGVIPNLSYSSTSSSTTISTSSYSSNSAGDEQPVDFSMNRTITHTRQEIIDELVEQMLSAPTDIHPGNTSKMNGTDSVRRKINPPGEER